MPIVLGSPAPDFTAPATGGTFSLAAQRGKKVVLYFYPKDNTPGCTTESLKFRDANDAFAAAGALIVGVSRDSLASHQRFQTKLGLPFALVSDTDETVCRAYDVIRPKKLYGKVYQGLERSTFLIDGDGLLQKEWRQVKVDSHVDDVLSAVQAL
ncbi:MAG: peroxiredoxin [Janthinobacterium lividum]